MLAWAVANANRPPTSAFRRIWPLHEATTSAESLAVTSTESNKLADDCLRNHRAARPKACTPGLPHALCGAVPWPPSGSPAHGGRPKLSLCGAPDKWVQHKARHSGDGACQGAEAKVAPQHVGQITKSRDFPNQPHDSQIQ